MLTVTTAADVTSLVTLASVKDVLRLTGSGDDAVLADLIADASQAIADHCNRATGWIPALQKYTENLPGFADNELCLAAYPIVGTPEVEIDGEAITDFEVSDAAAGVLYRDSGWPFTGSVNPVTGSMVPGSQKSSIVAIYFAGWLVPGQVAPDPDPATADTLPRRFRRACIETVKDWWLADQRDESIASRDGGGPRIQYQQRERGTLPPIVETLLRRDRSIA